MASNKICRCFETSAQLQEERQGKQALAAREACLEKRGRRMLRKPLSKLTKGEKKDDHEFGSDFMREVRTADMGVPESRSGPVVFVRSCFYFLGCGCWGCIACAGCLISGEQCTLHTECDDD